MADRARTVRILDVLRAGASGIDTMERAIASAAGVASLEEREPVEMRERATNARQRMRDALLRAIGVQEDHVREAARHGATTEQIVDATGWTIQRVDALLRRAH
jgi:hypothetical protein